ncbi:MAG: prefoldin subunit alpha [Candidatus Micrarchaeaceae archaeon]
MSDARIIQNDNMGKSKNSSAQEAINQLRYLQNVYSQQYELLENQISTYTISIDAILKGVEALEKITISEKNKTLINTGPGVYMEGEITNTKTTLTYVGAGYLIEKTISEAKEFIELNKKKQEEVLKKLLLEKSKLQNELIDIMYKLESIQQQ